MPNRLAAATSPYLLQHANNPVDWFQWGDEALSKARAEDKPVFLSIGYAACHWCHVMERESFENESIAADLNRHFVSIKVDREERPDLDEIYMACVQMLTGSGGWPMTVFLMPDGRPFYGGTYFPPEDRWGRPGFSSVLASIHEIWTKDRASVEKNAQAFADALVNMGQGSAPPAGTPPPEAAILKRAVRAMESRFDARWGGFGGAPKFPPSMALALLLRDYKRDANGHALVMAEKTLDRMARGGMYDQLGGGFHRYSTDERWLAPHFEKMLYDNALLAPVYFDAWRVTGDDIYRRVGRETLDWILREMTGPQGGIYSAQDADSEGVEGKFYIWTPQEIEAVIGAEDAALFCAYFDVAAGGNWHEGHGASILNIPDPPASFAAKRGMTQAELHSRIDPLRKRLLDVRARRIPPLTDDKVLVAWNGMAVSAHALGAQATGDARYAAAAAKTAGFILAQMRTPDGELLRAWRDGKAHTPAFLEDYAHFGCGLLDLFETDFDPRWLDAAADIASRLVARFGDPAEGGFYSTDGRDATVIARMRDTHDGATPSGTSAAVHLLRRLGVLLGTERFAASARATLAALAPGMAEHAPAHPHLLCAFSDEIGGAPEIVILGRRGDPAAEALLQTAWQAYAPGRAIVFSDPDGPAVPSPLLENRNQINNAATAYVCKNQSCREPVNSPDQVRLLL